MNPQNEEVPVTQVSSQTAKILAAWLPDHAVELTNFLKELTANRQGSQATESLLAEQLVILDSIFRSITQRTAQYVNGHSGQLDELVKAACRAQRECRQTAALLERLRNPEPPTPTTFIGQINQVNTQAHIIVPPHRAKVIELLQREGPLLPMMIAEKLGDDRAGVRKRLRRMVEERFLTQCEDGTYSLPASEEIEPAEHQ